MDAVVLGTGQRLVHARHVVLAFVGSSPPVGGALKSQGRQVRKSPRSHDERIALMSGEEGTDDTLGKTKGDRGQ